MTSASKPRLKNPDTMALCVSILVKRQGMSFRAATKRVEAISRQRMHKIINTYQPKAKRRKLARAIA